MKIARYQRNGRIGYGLVEGDEIQPIKGEPFEEPRQAGTRTPLSSVKLLAPVVPRLMLAVAVNYQTHVGHIPVSPRPEMFIKGNNTLANHGDQITMPAGCDRIDYEGELVAIIGRRCVKVHVDKALEYVLGYTCGNDISARDWQLGGDLQWFRGKSCDGFGPIGPWVVTGLNPTDLELRTRLNGEEVQSCNTGEMINSVAEIISFVSRLVTLEPGDVIFTGTPGQPKPMNPGDVVEVEVNGIGVLRNTMVADPAPMPWTDLRLDAREKP